MRRASLLVFVLPAIVVVAAAAKWRAQAGASSRLVRRGPATLAGPSAATEALAEGGLGAGPPPADVAGSRGASMLHGDRRHTDRAEGRAPTSLPAIAWSRDVGGPVEAQVTTSPDGETLYAASLGGSVVALARADGSEKWRLSLGDRGYMTPCVAHDGTVYVGSDAKKVYALAADGKIKWSFSTEGEADTGPVVDADGDVVFAAGHMVYALTPAGRIRWRFAARRKVFTSPAIGAEGRVFFGSQDHHVYALSPDGALVWSADLGADVDGAPAIGDDGAVFVGTDGDEVVRLDPTSGAVAWRSNVGGYVRGTLSIARAGDVLAGVYGPTPRAVRVRASDGRVMGQLAIQGTGAREFGVHGGALEDAAGTLLFGTQDDDVYAVGAGGELLWRFTTGGDVDAPLTLLPDGSVVVGSDDGKVYLLRSN